MEESEKRRERLRAMRLEATAEVVSSSITSSFPQQTLNSVTQPPLANPLLENVDANDAATPPPRFDFYTDPMAAYSTDKRRPLTPRPDLSFSSYGATGPRNPEMPHSGAHQFQNNYVPHPGMYQGGAPYHSSGGRGPPGSPMGWSPRPVHQGSPDFRTASGRGPCFNNTPSPGPGSGFGGSPNPMYQGSPNFRSPPSQGRGHWSNPSPRPSPGHLGSPSPNPVYQGFRSPPQGRGHWSNYSPRPSQGRGGGPSPSVGRGSSHLGGRVMSPSSGYSGRARSFYNKSMVEDPWESLTPIIWKGDKENDARSFSYGGSFRNVIFHDTPTLQKTPSAKKPRVAKLFDTSNSSPSLAEYLSESFNEAVEDTTTESFNEAVEDTTTV